RPPTRCGTSINLGSSMIQLPNDSSYWTYRFQQNVVDKVKEGLQVVKTMKKDSFSKVKGLLENETSIEYWIDESMGLPLTILHTEYADSAESCQQSQRRH
ncbi:hypothetical protein AVEN_25780-1, partial [Araneus ventricosus]